MRSHRAGLTLIEVVVALLVCSIGALAALSTLAAMVRERGRSSVLRDHVAAASGVLDSLASIRCATIAGGTRTTSTATYRWNVTPRGTTVEVTMDVQPTLGSATPWSVRTVVPCQ